MTPAFAGTRRFEIVRALGQGGMGIVFEAFDREQGTTCALKLLPRATPQALLRFKREFRALQGLSHPNLITLGELLNEDEHWFFTMELIGGVDFLAWVWRHDDSPKSVEAPATVTFTSQDGAALRTTPSVTSVRARFDEVRLREALAQLAEGLRFLHDAGKVHRDVKPSNVLVTTSGRVVLLDFGLVTDFGESEQAKEEQPKSATGTPGYMAPEHVLQGAVSPAADLYALGAILFRVLTGTLPSFDASIRSALLGGVMPAPRPSALSPGIPPLLDDLCAELLSAEPSLRPSAREVLARLGSAVPEGRDGSGAFVGRREELAQLMAAYEDSVTHAVVVALDGPSGIGKTALLAKVVSTLRTHAQHPLVLVGRCYEHEGIPYKAIDGVMDALGDGLSWAPEALLRGLPADASLLSVLFPALRRVPALDRAEPDPMQTADPSKAYDLRRGAERAGRRLFTALASFRPLVIVIDDFQWSDPDSLTFLSALTRGPDAPPFLLVLSSRTRQVATLGDDLRRISIEPLSAADARELAHGLLTKASGGVSQSAEAIVAEAGGNPFFVGELAWRTIDREDTQVRLEDVLWDRIRACGEEARSVLELVAVAAAPLPQRLMAEAAGMSAGSFTRTAQALRSKRLVRTNGLLPDDDVEAHHDRIRETVVARLSARNRALHHLRLANVLERARPEGFDALVTHFEGGGDVARAAGYAVRAGDQAARALAFERAAASYRRALAWLPDAVSEPMRLREKLADALANAGLGSEAAVEYERAATHAPAAHALELRRKAAEHLLRSGRLDDGLALLGQIFAELHMRMPRTPTESFASLLLGRLRFNLRGLSFTERPAEELAAADLFRADTLWAAAARLSPIDTIRASDFQSRHLLLCLRLGEPFRVARAVLAEAAFVSLGGPSREKRMQKILATVQPLVRRIQDPYATALEHFTQGFASYQFGRYAPALEQLTTAAALFRSTCTGASHDFSVSDRFALDCLFNLGELSEVARRVPLLLDDAERRGDLYLAAELRTGLPNIVWLCRDEPDAARRANDLGIAAWSRRSFYLQHYYHSLAAAHIALYVGDGAEAFRIVEQAWRRLRESLLLQVQAVRTEALYLRARAAIAHGTDAALGIAEKAVAKLSGEAVPSAIGLAAAARAGLAARRGEREQAILLLRRAEQALTGAGVGMTAAACRLQLGRVGSDAGAHALQAEAEHWMRKHGVAQPERFAELLVPGLMTDALRTRQAMDGQLVDERRTRDA